MNNLSASSVNHLLFAKLSLVVAKDTTSLSKLLLLASNVSGGRRVRATLLHHVVGGDATGNVDNIALYAVLAEVVLSRLEAISPLARGGILAAEEESKGNSGNDNTGDDKGDAPRRVRRDTSVDQRAVDGRHDKVCDTTTCVTQASSERVCSANNVLVEAASSPHLTRDESSTEDTDEETDSVKSSGARDGTSQKRRDGTDQQACCECDSGTETITSGARHKTDKKGSSQSNDIGVCDFVLAELHILGDDIAEEWREGIPDAYVRVTIW